MQVCGFLLPSLSPTACQPLFKHFDRDRSLFFLCILFFLSIEKKTDEDSKGGFTFTGIPGFTAPTTSFTGGFFFGVPSTTSTTTTTEPKEAPKKEEQTVTALPPPCCVVGSCYYYSERAEREHRAERAESREGREMYRTSCHLAAVLSVNSFG